MLCEFESCVSEILNQFLGIVNQFLGFELDVEPIVKKNIWDQFIAPGNGFSSESGKVTSEGEFEGCTKESSDPEDQESCHEHEMQDGTLILEENLNGFTCGVFGNLERGSCSHGVLVKQVVTCFGVFHSMSTLTLEMRVKTVRMNQPRVVFQKETRSWTFQRQSIQMVEEEVKSEKSSLWHQPVPEEEPFEPVMEGSSLLDHECRGHWPYDKSCVACCQARGRTPARRRAQKDESSSPHLAADYFYVGSRYWRILILLMINTGVVGLVVMGGIPLRMSVLLPTYSMKLGLVV